MIRLIKSYDSEVKLLANGYLMNKYKEILNECDEVVGELAVTSEEKFQKIERPLAGYSLKEYVSNMKQFNDQYSGKFILDITVLKNISDTDGDMKNFREFIQMINLDKIYFETPRGNFENTLGISQERISEITNQIYMEIKN